MLASVNLIFFCILHMSNYFQLYSEQLMCYKTALLNPMANVDIFVLIGNQSSWVQLVSFNQPSDLMPVSFIKPLQSY